MGTLDLGGLGGVALFYNIWEGMCCHMMKVGQLKANEVWIAIRINDSFLYINDVPYDIFILMDAVNAHVFGHVLSKAPEGAPSPQDVETLFKKAWSHTNKWPEKLIVPETSTASDVFKKEAKKNGVVLDSIPISELSPIIAPLIEKFSQDYK